MSEDDPTKELLKVLGQIRDAIHELERTERDGVTRIVRAIREAGL